MTEDRKNILVVEDDPGQRKILEEFLERRGYSVRSAPDAETAIEILESDEAALVLMDVRMPGMGGLEGLARMRRRSPSPAVILLTAFADVRDAVEAMREGAVDYLEKPIDLEELATVITETIGGPTGAPKRDMPPLPKDFVVASAAMRKVVGEADLVAPTAATVLITGESGTGKEKVAEFLHMRSGRRDRPFIRLNCGSIPETLFESELFGHARGAFTGAEVDRPGRFEAAGGGTLLLDELGELPLFVQPKLLRVLEGGFFERVGETQTRKSDARVIACTNRDVEREVAAGRFREDLFWRLNVFRIHVPPLRERREEITSLARAFLRRAGRARCRLSPATRDLIEAHQWPGNVRELANVMERAAILAAGDVILPDHLPPTLLGAGDAASAEEGKPGRADEGEVLTVEEAERVAIREALTKTGGNRTHAAKLLGISRRTLLYRIKKYGGEP